MLNVRLVNAGVNHVYAGEDTTGSVYVRFTHARLRDEAFLSPPVAYLRHAFERGAPVNAPLPSVAGAFVEVVRQGPDVFLASAVRGVPGVRLSAVPPTPEGYRAFGRALGELHAATRDFRPARGTPHMLEPSLPGVFPTWRWFWSRARADAARDPVIGAAFEALTPFVHAVGGLPTSWPDAPELPGGWGLTHGDARPGNALWHAGRVALIDFDEPVHGPLANDLARALLDLPPHTWRTLRGPLLDGYRSFAPLTEAWAARLPRLMAARTALMAAWGLEGGEGSGGASGSGAVVSVRALRARLSSGEFGPLGDPSF
ncbi:phosphotransferase enzyme family protein [Deinococcus maricopensis]|uniref:Aminoglycoside phosphotransferase n=1 Tax=Deinococcus maricopensis (strain DSM 21211 / LMG 22137 / NRRL B-23946 / LB-34) TaxID=709986 RepID=E8U9Q4_DEIML|nr:phosphotransferase [Deinococcus maricopensis]ADV67793.1 aminoglycoside phosphotransferase [Deinococcus maricopensis DSM 21211]